MDEIIVNHPEIQDIEELVDILIDKYIELMKPYPSYYP
jgi:hypothetical protein